MELKEAYVSVFANFCLKVLIVPLWNWKYADYGSYETINSSFNRTFMELKVMAEYQKAMKNAGF